MGSEPGGTRSVIMSNSPSMGLLVGSAEEEPGVPPAEQGHRLPGKPLGQGRWPGQPGRHVWLQLAHGPCEQGPGSPPLKPLPCFLQIPRAAASPLLYFILPPSARAELTYLQLVGHSAVPTLRTALLSLLTAVVARPGLAGGKEDLFSFIYLTF